MADDAVLELSAVRSGYSDVDILKGVDLLLSRGSVTAVIGANGAGKSTLLKTIFGLVPIRSGRLLFEGRDMTSDSSRARLRAGIVIVPQGRCNFPMLTIEENLAMGAYTRADPGVGSDIEGILSRFPIIRDRRTTLAGNMSGGEQQVLEMAMALMLAPKVMLIDEPSLGLSPAMQTQVFKVIRELADEEGVAVLLVEQNAVQALRAADRGVVVERGIVAYEGSGVQMLDKPEVRKAYLGLDV